MAQQTKTMLAELERQVAAGPAADIVRLRGILAHLSVVDPLSDQVEVLRVRSLLQAWIDTLIIPALTDLPAIAREAANAFSPDTVESDKQRLLYLRRVVDELDRYLSTDAMRGLPWRKYLHWNELDKLASSEINSSNLESIRAMHARFTTGNVALQFPRFAQVELALRLLLQRTYREPNSETAADYARRINAVAKLLEISPPEQIDDGGLEQLGATVLWLEERSLASRLAMGIRSYYARPNLLLTIAAGRVTPLFRRTITEEGNVNEIVLGTPVSGRAVTKGSIRCSLIPDPIAAIVELEMVLHTVANTVGRHPEAVISGTSNIDVIARKQLELDGFELRLLPATATGQTVTVSQGVSAGGGRRDQVASQQVQSLRGETERVSSEKARREARLRLDRMASDAVAAYDMRPLGKPRQPANRSDPLVRSLRCSTSESELAVEAWQPNGTLLGTPATPPEPREPVDWCLRMHESMICNRAATLLAGQKIAVDQLPAVCQKMFLQTSTTPTAESEPDEDRCLVEFEDHNPLVVIWNDKHCRIVLRCRGFTLGEDDFPAMDISANYVTSIVAGLPMLVREGPVSFSTPGQPTGARRTYSGKVQLMRKMLMQRFEQNFASQLDMSGTCRRLRPAQTLTRCSAALKLATVG